MRIEMLPGMTNVLRFPVERRARPTMALLREIAPDVREVLAMAEAFDFEPPPPMLRDETDLTTAEHIMSQFPAPARQAPGVLDGLLDPVVVRAIEACRVAHDAAADAAEAQQLLLSAQTAGSLWLDDLRDRAEALTARTVELLIEAHALAQQAEGVARAVGIFRRGEAWAPLDYHAETEALFALARRAG